MSNYVYWTVTEDGETGPFSMINTDWQPIETAPQDREVLVAHRYEDGSAEVAVAEWWVEGWFVTAKIPGRLEPSSFLPLAFVPTHWMPLPEPPSA